MDKGNLQTALFGAALKRNECEFLPYRGFKSPNFLPSVIIDERIFPFRTNE